MKIKKVFGEPHNPSDFWIGVFLRGRKNYDTVIHISAGTGDSLEEKEIKKGYRDYIFFDTFRAGRGSIGNLTLMKSLYEDLSLNQIIARVLRAVYRGSPSSGLMVDILE